MLSILLSLVVITTIRDILIVVYAKRFFDKLASIELAKTHTAAELNLTVTELRALRNSVNVMSRRLRN